ncbi:MAG: hypothetical protein IKC82_07110 [Lentisphaeria bacterium]|nr:hypothetical protein [Lentisphaeria bacterium]
MAVTATTVVVDKSLTEAKAAKEGLIFNANAFKVLADFYSSGSIWDNWSAGTLYLRDASSVLTQSDFENLDGRALSITGNVTDDDTGTIPAKNSLTFNGVSYTHDENENPFSVTHFLNITVKDSVFANTVISKNYTAKMSSRNDGSYAVDYSNNGSANISNSTIYVLDGYKNVTMLNSSAAKVTSDPEGRLTLTPGESGELSGTGTLGFGGSFTAKFDREQEDGYKIDGISGFKNVTLTGLDPRKFPENTTKISVGRIVGGKFGYTGDLENPTGYSDGSFSVSNGINVAAVSLFANVTVKDSSVGDIVGGESAMTVKSVTRNGMETLTATWRTGGRVTVNNSSAGNIIYYDSVALTNSSSGNIFRDPLSKMEIISGVGAIQYTASSGSVNVKADKNSKSKTITVGKSEPGEENTAIGGFANVNISGYRDNRAPENNVSVDVDGDIVGGNAEIFSSDTSSDTATGSITLANDVTVNGDLFYFANVTVKDGSSAGDIVGGDAVATEKITVKNGIESVTTTYRTGGRVTVNNSSAGNIFYYDSVALTNSSSGLIFRDSLSQTVTTGDTNYEYYTAAGSVNVRADAKFAGAGTERIISIGDSENDYDAIEGYANVNISGYRDNRAPENNVSIVVLNNIIGGNYGYYGIDQWMPMAKTATGSVTLANDVTVNGALLYFSNVTVKDGSSVSGLIDGGEFVGSSRSVKRNGIETVTTTWRTGGRVTVANSKVNDIKNYDSVTLTNSGSGAIYRDTLSKWEKVRDAEDELIYSLVTEESKGSVNVKADAKFEGEGADRQIVIGKFEGIGSINGSSIYGYANVNISGYRDNRAPGNNVSVMVKGNITGGNLTYDTLTNDDEQTTATGSITLANDVTVNGKISFFSNVNIKDSVVGDEIVYGDRKTTSKNSTKFSSDPSSEYRSLVTTVTYKNDGKLTAVNSELGQVSDYANVSLTNTDGGNISRNMLASDIIAEYQERQKNEEGKWGDWQSSGSEEHHTYSAAGSVTVRADKSGWDRATMDEHGGRYFNIGNIVGYMNVTVNGFNDRSKNNQDIKVQAGDITGGSYEGVSDGGSALGSANFNFASVGNVFGYKSVNAVDTNISGNVIAGSDAGFYGFDPESNDGEVSAYYGSYTYSSKGTANGFNASGVAKSADRFSLTNGWVEGDVRGYNVVTLTGGDVDGTVDLGVAYSDGHSYSDVNGESSSEYHKTTATASATVRNAEVGGDITGYRMVTVDNSSVGGDIEFIDVEREDDAIQISTSYFNDGSGSSKGEITGKEIATGSLTVRDSEVNGDIRGYNSVNFTNGSAGKEKNINNWIYNYNAKYSIKDGETVENNATLEYKASGNFTARVDKKGESDLYQFGSISGFEKVAISGFADKTAQKSVIVNGSITGGKLSIKGEAEISAYGFLIDDIPEINASDSVFAASGSVVLEKKVTVRGDIYGFDSVTVKDSAVAGEIKATPYEFDFKAVPDYVDYSEFAVSGKLVNLTDGKAGRVTGYKQVNISGIYNEIDYYTGTAGDDTLKIAGNSALRVNSLDFGEGEKDKLLLEGTLIIDDPINLNWALESVSGRGAIAAATDNLADAESVCGTDINFIDLGDVADGFKGAAWELADDSAVKAAFWDGESFLTGWLCGDFDSNYKTVVDTVDYIRFTATDDGYLGFGGDANIIAVSGWEVGAEDKLFTSNNFYVAAGSEYIIKLEREDANSASYTVKFNSLPLA